MRLCIDSSAMVATRIRSVPKRAFTPALLAQLHSLSDRLLAESAEHFRIHAESNDMVHVFERTDTSAPVGFQFWRTAAMEVPGWRALIGGKLRVEPEFRNRALHLRSGVRFYFDSLRAHPRMRFYRLSLASLFGFVSITSALSSYHLFDAGARDVEGAALHAAFVQLATDSRFRLDERTGLFSVGIRMKDETVAQYPASYYQRREARIYIDANPQWRSNGCYVAFWFRFTPANLAKLAWTIARKW